MLMFRTLPALVFACLLMTGCTEDSQQEVKPASAADLPADLCDYVDADVVARWALEATSHDTTKSEDTNVATCEMTGTYEGEPVELAVHFRTYAATSVDDARAVTERALAEQCEQLDKSAIGQGYDESDSGCSFEPPAGPVPAATTVVDIRRAIPARGLVRVEMSHAGQGYQLLPADVVAVSTPLLAMDPANLEPA